MHQGVDAPCNNLPGRIWHTHQLIELTPEDFMERNGINHCFCSFLEKTSRVSDAFNKLAKPKLERAQVGLLAIHAGFEFQERGALFDPFPGIPRIPGHAGKKGSACVDLWRFSGMGTYRTKNLQNHQNPVL
jgi:hypothetical protein